MAQSCGRLRLPSLRQDHATLRPRPFASQWAGTRAFRECPINRSRNDRLIFDSAGLTDVEPPDRRQTEESARTRERTAMNKVNNKIKDEFLALLPPTLFFFIALHIVGVVRALMAKGTGMSPASTISIAVAALILGKAVLIAD